MHKTTQIDLESFSRDENVKEKIEKCILFLCLQDLRIYIPTQYYDESFYINYLLCKTELNLSFLFMNVYIRTLGMYLYVHKYCIRRTTHKDA